MAAGWSHIDMTMPLYRRYWRGPALAAAVIVLIAAQPAAVAQAAASLSLNPASARPGAQITATGAGFPTFGGNQIKLAIGQTVLTTVAYQPPGFTAVFSAPNLTPGFHTVTACVANNGVCSTAPGTSAQARLRIEPPPTQTTPPRTPVPPPPATPGDLQISLDPLCCDPPAPSNPVNLAGPKSPTPGPAIQNPGPAPDFPDLYILGVEVTQNIQDLKSQMPLVADRKTWIRVHPRANVGNWAPVDGAILVKRGGEQEILYPVNGPLGVGLTTDRTETDSALNFVLDPKWYAEGNLSVSALVWAYGPSTLDDKEPNPENNFMKLNVNFKNAKKPNIHVVPLDDGAGPGPNPSLAWTVSSAQFVSNNIVRYHPLADTNLTLYPIPLSPATGGGNGGLAAISAWDLSSGTGRTQPLQKLFWYHQVLNLPADERLFGMFDSSIPSGGYTGWAKSSLKSAWTMPSGTTPSHEAGHLTGLGHVDCVGSEEAGGALDKTHPNAAPNCSLAPVNAMGYFGMTVFDTPFNIYSNNPSHPKAAFPLMSYASTKWNDAYHWCLMLTYYEVPCSPEGIGVPGKPIPNPTRNTVDCDESVTGPNGMELKICLADPSTPNYSEYPTMPATKLKMAIPAKPQAWVLVTGVLTKDGGTITQAALVDKLAPSLAALAAEEATGSGAVGKNEIAVRDSAGAVIARVKVGELGSADMVHLHGDKGTETAVGEFAKVIPVAGQISAISLLSDGNVKSTRKVSNAAPAIGGLAVNTGADGTRITWNVSDPDGDAVRSTVLWSADGVRWLPVALDTDVTSVLIGPGVAVPGGTAVKVKVIANDGVRNTETVSTPFAMAARKPLVSIGELPDGSTIPRYFLGDLSAFAFDPEEGDLAGSAISWKSSLDGDLGSGGRLSLRRLSLGEHTITASVTDGSGANGVATLKLTVADGGAGALRTQGAEPDAERRLLAGAAVPPEHLWLWLGAGGAAAVAIAGVVWFLIRRRRSVIA